ncbi:MAG: hypothetical protein AVDCRST_MAG68-4053 [uncultured Gemmatimonadetes bacterium]|uniref:Uncharacterized protein n=1 Tax=uncultured Gemmatimonadota bacterium TaxID=203437 RepID=A0A6J4M1Z4_9BACT|nr:MAG: hypothetical protein AVDCRST_MAG68-4053 [uncultured Gemmatimonadota bacterium]
MGSGARSLIWKQVFQYRAARKEDLVKAAAGTLTPGSHMELTQTTPSDLIGVTFTAVKGLRHLAEEQFGQLFVRTEVLSRGTRRMVVELRLDAHGILVIHAERARPSNPFCITRVHTGRDAGALRMVL